jgi:hypothetical protein
MKKIFTLVSLTILSLFGHSQVLGVYEFAGANVCPVENPNVTIQPTGATFSAFTAASSLACVGTANVFNNQEWGNTFNPDKYYEFSLNASSNYSIRLDSILFTSRLSNTTCTWHLRSSVDNFAADIASGTNTNELSTTRLKLNTNTAFNTLTFVTFRFYVSAVDIPGRAWRIDDVTLKGSLTSTLGIEENTSLISKFSPNPGRELVSVILKEDVENASISVYSTSGQLVFTSKFSGNKTFVNTEDFGAGIYFISLNDGNNSSTFKWIKE